MIEDSEKRDVVIIVIILAIFAAYGYCDMGLGIIPHTNNNGTTFGQMIFGGGL